MKKLAWDKGFRRLTLTISLLSLLVIVGLVIFALVDWYIDEGRTAVRRTALRRSLEDMAKPRRSLEDLGKRREFNLAILAVATITLGAGVIGPWLLYFLLRFIMLGFLPPQQPAPAPFDKEPTQVKHRR